MQAKAAESGEGWSLSDDGTLTISADFSGSWIGDYPWYSYQESIKKVIINEGVTSIGYQAFYGCSSLTSINIPEGVTSIGSGAFSRCSSLTSINIPESVTSIGYGAFAGCSSLTSIKVDENNAKYDSRDNCNAIIKTESNTLIAGCQNTIIPESVTSIGEAAFEGCSSLTSINIPESVTFIGYVAFYYCSSLTSVYSYATTPAKLISGAFSNTNENLIIYIPKGTTEAYKAAWREEFNFVEMPASFEYDSNYGDIKLIKWTSSEADIMTIRIEPAEGYKLQSITVNGNDILSAANDATLKAVLNADDTYTISGLTEDNMVVVVNFGAAVVTPVQNTASNQEAEIAAVYSLTGAYVGKSLKNLQNGLYIVVYSNGKIDKVLVK